MFSKLFGKSSNEKPKMPTTPSILGLRIGCSFELDSLFVKLLSSELTTENISSTYIIHSAGIVDLGGSWIFRFYTDDDAFLQVVTEGGKEEEHVVDVKLFHYYDTLDVSNQHNWDELLNQKIGTETYTLNDQLYYRVWQTAGAYHQPVAMTEKTYDGEGDSSSTDQFTMLFERDIGNDNTETLFLSAEEIMDEQGQLSRCFVRSTGMTLTPAQITIHG
ncbi:YjfK family protein [Marinibactrum halimedae]|uniref:DUF2491 family protein n=1 Tax=Marinibactrum halimedae TaxID=1444977 RepID=A0AA37T5E5_9GAMM|nr:YjfK family protein [Marinibactrum halimedae]MCD9459169.1 YjfK family protein [Marinibactrum halimedae]GLS27240.1 hypothetical protein GCM10007877_29590 [Marinibactrum halimedae]